MHTLFISDLHLDEARPHVTNLFLDFLSTEAPKAQALYILGDLFEAWIGDDNINGLNEKIAQALHRLSRIIPVYFMAGNRDFLVGADYAGRSGLQILEEPVTVELYGVPTLLIHGDVLCTDDTEYMAFRSMVRAPGWQRSFLEKSLAERQALADMARARSGQRLQELTPEIMDVNPLAVEQMYVAHPVRQIIHGHTHRPKIHELVVSGIPRQRIVLGDWYTQGSVLRVDDKGPQLRTLIME